MLRKNCRPSACVERVHSRDYLDRAGLNGFIPIQLFDSKAV